MEDQGKHFSQELILAGGMEIKIRDEDFPPEFQELMNHQKRDGVKTGANIEIGFVIHRRQMDNEEEKIEDHLNDDLVLR
jgi:hypothetical protein